MRCADSSCTDSSATCNEVTRVAHCVQHETSKAGGLIQILLKVVSKDDWLEKGWKTIHMSPAAVGRCPVGVGSTRMGVAVRPSETLCMLLRDSRRVYFDVMFKA